MSPLPPEEFEVPPALAGERVDRALALLTGRARAEIAQACAGGQVLVDGAPATKARRLESGERVTLLAPPIRAPALRADPAVPVEVRHEDADVIVVAKPAGLVVHPGAGHPTGTLVEGLLARYPELRDVGPTDRPGIVHRLDRGTSGLLVVARSARAYDALVAALAGHEVIREYAALAWGHLAAPKGAIDAPIGRDGANRTRMAVRTQGRAARTNYEVRRELSGPPVSLLACRLETGRTHQIRVHLAAIGHPVVGDARYGGRRPSIALERPFLHAGRLAFAHPAGGRRVEVEEPLPADLQAVLDRLEPAGEG